MTAKTLPIDGEPQVGQERRCDNCAAFYLVTKKGKRFCTDNCRKYFHRYGPPLLKLRDIIDREVTQQLAAVALEIEARWFSCLDPASQERYRRRFPKLAARFDSPAVAQTVQIAS